MFIKIPKQKSHYTSCELSPVPDPYKAVKYTGYLNPSCREIHSHRLHKPSWGNAVLKPRFWTKVQNETAEQSLRR